MISQFVSTFNQRMEICTTKLLPKIVACAHQPHRNIVSGSPPVSLHNVPTDRQRATRKIIERKCDYWPQVT